MNDELDELNLVSLLASDGEADPNAVDEAREELRRMIEQPQLQAVAQREPSRIVPYLIYDEPERAVTWLTRAFGFVELPDGRVVDDEGIIQHAELELNGAVVMMGPPSIHGDSPSRGVSAMLDVTVDDVTAHYRRARRAGADIVIELEDAPWGVRRYQARDIEGHQWQFSQPLAEAS